MKIHEECLPCLVNQAIRTAKMLQLDDRESLYQKIFQQMSRIDFSRTNPEIIGENFRLIKAHCRCDDPYREMKAFYNRRFLQQMHFFEEKITTFSTAVKHAILANIIDFNPAHDRVEADIRHAFAREDDMQLTVDDTENLLQDIRRARTILYLGDNCGEICFDKLLIRYIRKENPDCKVYFAVRGEAVVNDNTMEDALSVGMDEVAEVVSNGDSSLGTVLPRVSASFRAVYDTADVVIAKGQANYESLSEEEKNIYFLLMAKCPVMAACVGVPEKALVCMQNRKEKS